MITDFSWYISVLVELAVIITTSAKHAPEVASLLIEIAVRVEAVRPYAVEAMLPLLTNSELIVSTAKATVAETLRAAAWIIGEYSEVLTHIANDHYSDEDDDNGYWILGPVDEEFRSDWRGKNVYLIVMDSLLHPHVRLLPTYVQTVYIHAAFKIFIRASSDCSEKVISQLLTSFRKNFEPFTQVSFYLNYHF